jgi:hypothetical protein
MLFNRSLRCAPPLPWLQLYEGKIDGALTLSKQSTHLRLLPLNAGRLESGDILGMKCVVNFSRQREICVHLFIVTKK